MPHYGNAALGQMPNRCFHARATFKFHRLRTGFLNRARGIVKRMRRAFFVSAKRQINNHQRFLGPAHHRRTMGDHHFERHTQRRFHAIHDHAEAVANEQKIDMRINQFGRMRVIGCQANNGVFAFARH